MQTGKPPETSPQSGRERARAVPPGGSPLGCWNQRLAGDILAICSERSEVSAPKQASRERHPHNLGANGGVSYSLAAPPGGAEASASLL